MRRTTALTTTSLSATAIVGLALLTPGTAAVAAVETCHGEVATIVGAPGKEVVGTEGRDVVVTDGAARVTTLGGDDLVCITGDWFNLEEPITVGVDVAVDAGAGEDVVDTLGADLRTSVVLGAGADRFQGGPGLHYVIAGEGVRIPPDKPWEMAGEHRDIETDVLLGGVGSDYLVTGQAGVANHDTVLGGPDSDSITWAGQMSAAARLAGGPRPDRLTVVLDAGHTSVDARTGFMTTPGGTVSWTSMEFYAFTARAAAPRALTFRGTEAPDELHLAVGGGISVIADLAGGDDVVSAEEAPAAGSEIDAGGGRDVLWVGTRSGSLDLDLRAEVLEVASPVTTHSAGVSGFEVAQLSAPEVVLAGTPTRNFLVAHACRAEVTGRGGRDSIELYARGAIDEDGRPCRGRLDGGAGPDTIISSGPSRDRIRGGGGRDELLGGRGPDLLLGGPGSDSGHGGLDRDVDTCRTEREVRCER